MTTTGETISAALRTAGLGTLPPSAKAWAAERLARFSYTVPAYNIGGIVCTLPHGHGDGRCLSVVTPYQEQAGEWRRNRVRHLARLGSWGEGARLFVAVARRAGASPDAPAPDLPSVGFRSVHPVEGEEVGDFRETIQDGWRLFDPLGAKIVFGPDAESEAAFRGLLTDWESFERAGVPAKFPELRDTHAEWITFRDKWLSGQADPAFLNPHIEDANRVRKTLAEKTTDPQWNKPDRQGVDVEHSSLANQAATQIINATKDSPLDATNPLGWLKRGWASLSLGSKVAVGAGVVLVGAGALAYTTAPILLALSGGLGSLGLGAHEPQVVIVEPGSSSARKGKAR